MNNKYSIKELPISERPYEKCLSRGVQVLSDAELLAVVLRTGSHKMDVVTMAKKVLSYSKEFSGLLMLNHLNTNELMKIDGIGKVKAVQVQCIAELAKRMSKARRKEGVRLLSPEAVANYYMEDMRHLPTEQIMLVMVDSKSKILSDEIISSGTVNASIVTPRELYIRALKQDAVNILLLHNHPSGDPTPSKEDIYTTKRVKEAGLLIGIPLVDHIIIGDNSFVSLKEQGLL